MATEITSASACREQDIKQEAKEIVTRDILSDKEFSFMMWKGLKQAKMDDGVSVSNTFEVLERGLEQESDL